MIAELTNNYKDQEEIVIEIKKIAEEYLEVSKISKLNVKQVLYTSENFINNLPLFIDNILAGRVDENKIILNMLIGKLENL